MSKFALVISIPEYNYFKSLPKTTNDAETIARLLHDYGGYQITRVPHKGNADTADYEMKADKVMSSELYQTIQQFLEDVKGRPSLIYFTGHGFTVCDRLQRTSGYLATSDCRVSFKDNQIIKQENGFPLEDLDYLIKEANLSELVVLLDCCHSGHYIESSLMRQSLKTFEHKQNYYLITACRSSETAKTIRKDEHSVFSGAIIKGLSANNVNYKGEISCDRLFDSVDTEIGGKLQTPLRMGIGNSITLVKYSSQGDSKNMDQSSQAIKTHHQEHSGSGDNVGRDKYQYTIIVNLETNAPESTSSEIYISYPLIEKQCYDEIERNGYGALLRISAPQKMGKTSLLNRILNYGKSKQYESVSLSIKDVIDETLNENSENSNLCYCFNQKFLSLLYKELKQESAFNPSSQSQILNVDLTIHLKNHVLSRIPQKLVLGIDNFEYLFEYKIIFENFCSLLRSWHDSSKENEQLEKLQIIIVHSTENYIRLDINRSPFNVGTSIKLEPFYDSQVKQLCNGYSLDVYEQYEQEMITLTNLVGGHPNLIKQLIEYIQYHPHKQLTGIINLAPTEQGIFRNHLRELLEILRTSPKLKNNYLEIIQQPDQGCKLEDDEVSFKLYSLGLIKYQGNYSVSSCDLYRLYLQEFLN